MSFQSVLALEKKYCQYKENFDFLIEIPFIQKLLRENRKLKKENKRLLKYILNQDSKDESSCQTCRCSPIVHIDLTSVEEDSKENILYDITEIPVNEKAHIKTEVVETVCEVLVEEQEEEVEVEQKEVLVEEQDEEEAVVEQEEEEEEEEVVEEQVVEEQEEEEEEVVEEQVVEEQDEEVVEEEVVEEQEEEVVEVEQEEVVEEEVVEVEEVEQEVEEEQEVEVEQEEEEEDEVYEVTINGKVFYVTNETNSVIYGLDENGDISVEAGKYVDGNPVFV